MGVSDRVQTVGALLYTKILSAKKIKVKVIPRTILNISKSRRTQFPCPE
jgi:hypothetical protein